MSAFYVSNVEQYLHAGRYLAAFCANVASLPLDETSTFIRSIRDRTPNSPFALMSELGHIPDEVKNCGVAAPP